MIKGLAHPTIKTGHYVLMCMTHKSQKAADDAVMSKDWTSCIIMCDAQKPKAANDAVVNQSLKTGHDELSCVAYKAKSLQMMKLSNDSVQFKAICYELTRGMS